jgi:hypothetical protein
MGRHNVGHNSNSRHCEEPAVSVEAPLCFGQLYSWREIESYPREWLREANLPATWHLRGLSMAQVDAALRRLVDWHEPLRTSYQLRDGVPVQQVHPEVELPIGRVDRVVTGHDEPDRTTAALLDVPIPMTGGLCWQGVLVSTGGAPIFLSMSFSHLILDGWSIHELESQFRAVLHGATAVRLGPSARELARQQRDPASATRTAGAERYWRGVLTDPDVHRLPTLPMGAQRNRIQTTLHSRRLGGLAEQAAKQLSVTPSTVLMALAAAGLARHTAAGSTGSARVAVSLLSSNRSTPEYRHVVGTMNQLIPVVSTVDAGATVGEHITALHRAATRACRYSCYDIDRVREVAAEVGATAAHDGWFNQLYPSWFSYRQLDGEPPDAEDRTPAELAWTPLVRTYGQPFDVRVTARGGRTSVTLRVDPEVIPAEALTAILRDIALGVQRAVSEPTSSLKDLWTAATGPHPALYPQD